MSVQFYGVVDRGRLHIAADEKYQGSVNSYNNWLTRLFAWIFGLSMDVTVNSQIYCVNKRSYTQLLQSIGVGSVEQRTIQVFKNLDRISIDPMDNGYMRAHLTQAKVRKLGIEMIWAMAEKKDKGLAERLLGEGADPDIYFCTRGWDGKLLIGENPEERFILPKKPAGPFTEGKYTLLLYAVRNGDTELRDRLLRYGASRDVLGMECVFERKIATQPNKEGPGISTPNLWLGCRPVSRVDLGGHRRQKVDSKFLLSRTPSLGEALRSVQESHESKDVPGQKPQVFWDVHRDIRKISYNDETKELIEQRLEPVIQETTI